MPYILRFNTTLRGALTFTGNTLGLSGTGTIGVAGDFTTINGFTTINTNSVFGTYPNGTTGDYTLNSSSAILQLPLGSSVVYAELIWAGQFATPTIDLSARINDPVQFTTPSGMTVSVPPDPNTIVDFDRTIYVRSANVTSLVAHDGAGTYTCGSVVGTIVTGSSTNHAGWTLQVAYTNPALPFRNLTLFVGSEIVASNVISIAPITGFVTPLVGPITGRLLASAQEGDADLTGDQLLFGPNMNTLSVVSGPNNFPNNFFASQINGDNGQLNTTGTFGDRNAVNGEPGFNTFACRQGWDITNVDVSSFLVNNQSAAIIQATSQGDIYVVNGLGLQIDAIAPTLAVTKSGDRPTIAVGETLTFSFVVTNTGTLTAENIIFQDNASEPPQINFVPGSVRINGVSNPALNPLTGFNLSNLSPGASVQVSYMVEALALPSGGSFVDNAVVRFEARLLPGEPLLPFSVLSNTVTTQVVEGNVTIQKSADRTTTVIGDTVTYTLQLTSSGNATVTNVSVTDNIPNGTVFVTNSVFVNGVNRPGADPVSGIIIGTLPPGGTATVTFQVRVAFLPSPEAIINRGFVQFTVGMTPRQNSSNEVVIPILQTGVDLVKEADMSFAFVGEPINYTIRIINTGTADAVNVILTDPLPDGATFIPNSVTLDGVPQPGANLANGFNVGTVPAGVTRIVTYTLEVMGIPPSQAIMNMARAQFQFIVGGVPVPGSAESDTVNVPVGTSGIQVTKSTDSVDAIVGETITYTVVYTNQGSIPVDRVVLTDALPDGTRQLQDSVFINGVQQFGAEVQAGVSLGRIAAGQSVTVVYSVVVDGLPASGTLTNVAQTTGFLLTPDGREVPTNNDSNFVVIPVFMPGIDVAKSANVTEAFVGEEVVYTVVVTNTGNTIIADAVLADALPAASRFVDDSVVINGVGQPGENPQDGIFLGSLSPGQVITIMYTVEVDALPTPAELFNRATANFDFQLPSGRIVQGSMDSNAVVIPVFAIDLTITKSGTPALVNVGDVITYTLVINNGSQLTATNSVLIDALPAGAAFVPNSVTINGIPQPGANPATGIPLATIVPLDSITVTYQLTVVSVPNPKEIVNRAQATFDFVSPGGNVVTDTIHSNVVIIPVNSPIEFDVTVTKSADRTTAFVGETLTYTVIVENASVNTLTSTVVVDPLPDGSRLVPDSVTVNGTSVPGADPVEGVSIGTIVSGTSVTIMYKVLVESTPIPPELMNMATANYIREGVGPETTNSNTVVIPVVNTGVILVKSADASLAFIGETVTYTIVVDNTANVLATAVALVDPLPDSTRFVANSVTVNGSIRPGIRPDTGIPLGNLAPTQSVTITFQVEVTALPEPPELVNIANLIFTFIPPSGEVVPDVRVASNVVRIPVIDSGIRVTKSANKQDVLVDETLQYTVVVANNGSNTAANTVLTDSIPNGTRFVAGTVVINGIAAPNADPTTGISLGTLASGASVTVTYVLEVTGLPDTDQIANTATASFTIITPSGTQIPSTIDSNTIITPVASSGITIRKQANVTEAQVGSIITYTLNVRNSGSLTATNITIRDALNPEEAFVAGSVTVNGVTQPNVSPSTGISLGSLSPGQEATITYQIQVVSLPSPPELTNTAVLSALVTTQTGRVANIETPSNTVITPVISVPTANIVVQKSANTQSAALQDVITYSIVVTNQGNVETINTVIVDQPPSGTEFVAGSVTVQGGLISGASPLTGIPLGTLLPSASVTVTFQVRVVQQPVSSSFVNQAQVQFQSVSLTGELITQTVASNAVTVAFTRRNEAILSKMVNTGLVHTGMLVGYIITLRNTGSTTIVQAVLNDRLPAGLQFIPGTLTLNGVVVPNQSLTSIPLPQIPPGGEARVAYKARIKQARGSVTNVVTAEFGFLQADGTVIASRLSASATVNIEEMEE
ncbi:DUF7507 domain-containing protein [Paenibacillus sp. 481]|uniref:DUF7507 domain-containing protein n=1 Tax=Paenibacillus sp. 481 TaxID=2835869 RepID=UPI001E2FFE0C|nr:DUF11 domain-containing protein [Paenibacillus sp. 481]UHA74272.1 DUF11 domain-containing protein [Paenibacillus sp. 481]